MEKSLDGIHYWVYGDAMKPPLLMIHGFTGSHEGFQYLIPLLSKSHYVIVPDLPGFGASPLDFAPWTIDALAKRTNRFVKTLAPGRTPFVVSHSMGGLVAASMLASNPELFAAKTVFVSPVATKVTYLDRRKLGVVFGALHYNVGKRTGRFGDKLVRSRRISRFVTDTIMAARDRELRRRIHQHHFENLEHISSIDYYHQLHKDINRRGVIDYKDRLASFRILIISGEKDNVTPLIGERKLARELAAKLVTIPGAGHLAHYEKPEAITRPLLDFLE